MHNFIVLFDTMSDTKIMNVTLNSGQVLTISSAEDRFNSVYQAAVAWDTDDAILERFFPEEEEPPLAMTGVVQPPAANQLSFDEILDPLGVVSSDELKIDEYKYAITELRMDKKALKKYRTRRVPAANRHLFDAAAKELGFE